MTLYYLLTEECNLRCLHCIRGMDSRRSMEYASAVRELGQLHELYPDAVLALSGGEPTLYPHFQDLLQRAAEQFRLVVINSNGTTSFWRNSADLIKRDNIVIQFSLDGLEDYHDNIRGKGSFSKTLDNIRFLNDLGKPIVISTVVSKKNMSSVLRMPEILADFRIENWHISPIMPFGNAELKDVLDVDKWNRFVDDIIDITPFRLGIRKLFDKNLLGKLSDGQILELAESRRNIDFKNCGCVKSKLYIYPDMTVYACTCMKDIPLGNMQTQTLADILKSDVSQSFLNYVCDVPDCRKCRYFKICNGGCMGMQKKYGYDIRCPMLGQSP